MQIVAMSILTDSFYFNNGRGSDKIFFKNLKMPFSIFSYEPCNAQCHLAVMFITKKYFDEIGFKLNSYFQGRRLFKTAVNRRCRWAVVHDPNSSIRTFYTQLSLNVDEKSGNFMVRGKGTNTKPYLVFKLFESKVNTQASNKRYIIM